MTCDQPVIKVRRRRIRLSICLILSAGATVATAASVQLTVQVSADSILLLKEGLEIASDSGMLLKNNPQEGLSVGFDYIKKASPSCVGDWTGENPFNGTIETVKICHFEKGSEK